MKLFSVRISGSVGVIVLPILFGGCILLDRGFGIKPHKSESGWKAYKRIAAAGAAAYYSGCSVWTNHSMLHVCDTEQDCADGDPERTGLISNNCILGDPGIALNAALAGLAAVHFSNVKKDATYKEHSVTECTVSIFYSGSTLSLYHLIGKESENFVTNPDTSARERRGVKGSDFPGAALIAGMSARGCRLQETNPIIETGQKQDKRRKPYYGHVF